MSYKWIKNNYNELEENTSLQIKKFNGYCMNKSVDELKELSIKEVSSVSVLIRELMEDNNEQL